MCLFETENILDGVSRGNNISLVSHARKGVFNPFIYLFSASPFVVAFWHVVSSKEAIPMNMNYIEGTLYMSQALYVSHNSRTMQKWNSENEREVY